MSRRFTHPTTHDAASTPAFTPGEAGRGAVKISLRSVNRNALWPIPATSCSGTLVLS